MIDRFSRWLGQDRTESIRSRDRKSRRAVAMESLEGRVLLSGVNLGDSYLYDGNRVPLNRSTEQLVVGLKAGVTSEVVARLTAEGGPLAGSTPEATANPSLWIIKLPGAVPYEDLAKLDDRASADPGVDYVTTAFVDPDSDYPMWATRDVVVALRPGVDPAAYFAGPSFASYRPLRGTTDQFVATTTAEAGPATVALANRLGEDARVRWSSPDFYKPIRYQALNDPMLAQQWHLNNTGQTKGTTGADARAFGAWDLGASGQGVIVAIVDSGVDIDHEDLRANIYTNPGEVPGNGVDDDNNGYTDDVNGWNFSNNTNNPRPLTVGHGTSVAGVAAAVGNNGVGVAGAAYKATILPVTLGEFPLSGSALAEAVYYGSGRNASGVGFWAGGAAVLNHSYGGGGADNVEAAAYLWSSQNGRGGKGSVNLAATGNDGSATVSYPAAYPGTIAVGASTDGDVRSSYSQYGPEIDIVAPSGGGNADITTTDITGSAGYAAGNYAADFSGTSSATPLAAGVVALVLEVNPNLTYDEVVSLLRANSAKVGGLPYDANGFNVQYGYGRIDAARAVADAQARTFKVLPIAFSATEATPFDGDVAEIQAGTVTVTPGSLTASINWGDGQVTVGSVVQAGSRLLVRGRHTYAEGGTNAVTVTVTQANGNVSKGALSVVVRGLPIVASGTALSLREGDNFTGVLARFRDTSPVPQGVGHYVATINFGDGTSGVGTILSDGAGGFNVVDRGGHLYGGGSYTVTVSISDPGTTATATSSAIVIDSPLTASGLAVKPVEGTPFPGALATFSDADPRIPPLTNYFATINWGDGTTTDGKVRPNPVGGGFIVTGDRPLNFGSYRVVVTIGNRSGGNQAVAITTADVANAPLSSYGFDFTPSAGVSFGGVLAAFSDGDPRPNPVTHYLATVDWGDGTSGPAQVVVNSDGGYLIRASHAYRPGVYTIRTRINDVDGAETVSTGTARVPDAPATLRFNPTFSPREGAAPGDPIVAVISTENLLAAAGDFRVTINYGDGTTGPGEVQNTGTPGVLNVLSRKPYDSAGTYPIGVVLTSPGGTQVQATGTVVVAAAPISASPLPVSGVSKTRLAAVPVASFTTANARALARSYSASINWGDGQVTAGTVVANGAGGFNVVGDHTFAGGGTFRVGVTITGIGVSQTVSTSAGIGDLLFPITGGATSAAGGTVSADGTTNSGQPIFTGSAEPFASVQIFAAAGGASPTLIGSGKADASGRYAITGSPLADGQYTILASASDRAGKPSSALTTLYPSPSRGQLTVDTQGPRVARASFNARTGKVTLVLADGLSGLGSGMRDAANFSLRSATGQTIRVTGLTASANADQTATLTFGTARPLGRGTYVLTVSASGVTDRAGNALDERYFVPFPGLYNRAGQDFTAAFRADGRAISQARQFIPPSELVAAQRHRLFVRRNLRRG